MPRTTNPRFQLSPFWHAEDREALALFIDADSGAFSGHAEVEIVAPQMREVGECLRDFPSAGLQSEVVWELRGWMSPTSSRLRFYFRDAAGHAAIEAILSAGTEQVESATVSIPIEVAAINRMGERLIAWSGGKDLEDDFELAPNA
jgi:hypothetical protein